MTRLLIVDDEHYIVNYLVALFEEQQEQELDVYKVYSGVDALQLLQTAKIDIILLDIHMPGLSGLEIAERICISWPSCRIIFLTAFDNFEYIYRANKIKNTSYLLKTETDEIIKKKVFSVITEINQEIENSLCLSTAKQKEKLLTYLLQQSPLRELVTGQDIAQQKKELQLTGSDFVLSTENPVYIMYMQLHRKALSDHTSNHSTQVLRYLQLMEQLLCNKFNFTLYNASAGVALWFFQPKEGFDSPLSISSPSSFLKGMMEDIITLFTQNIHRDVTLILNPKAIPFSEVCGTFHAMQQQAETLTFRSPSQHSFAVLLDSYSQTDKCQAQVFEKRLVEKQCKSLSFHLYEGSCDDYMSILRELHQTSLPIKSMHNTNAVKTYCTIALMLLNYISQYKLEEVLAMKIALYPLYYLHDFHSWDSAFHYLEKLSSLIFEILQNNKIDKNQRMVNIIKNYINQHLTANLNLSTISEVVNYNESYVSRLFKQTTGIGISEYVNQARLEKAKMLLSTSNESIQNIASATGFDTSQYFSSVFKKTIGISPSDYRNSHNTSDSHLP